MGFDRYTSLVSQFTSLFFRGGPVTVYLDPGQRAWKRYRPLAASNVPGTYEGHTFLSASGKVLKGLPGYPVG